VVRTPLLHTRLEMPSKQAALMCRKAAIPLGEHLGVGGLLAQLPTPTDRETPRSRTTGYAWCVGSR